MLKMAAKLLHDRLRERERERERENQTRKEYFPSRTTAKYTFFVPLSPFLLAETIQVHLFYSEGLE
jgi:deoxyadenosine/deoxycytidine kinase